MLHKILLLSLIFFSLSFCQSATTKGNAIFIHPDGTGLADWNALRILKVGPDGELNWDKMNSIGLYQRHIRNRVTASLNAGATIHAYGVKANGDETGGVVVRANGLHSDIMNSKIDNTDIYRFIYLGLFGKWLE